MIGLAASGLHSNGYSLVRKVVFEMAEHKLDDHVPELKQTVRDALLTPTRIYAKPVRRILSHYTVKNVVHGIAHITGGGLHENLERIVPAGCRVLIDRDSWPVPPVFPWLQRLGAIADAEMQHVFNMGVGLALVVSPYYVEHIRGMLDDSGVANWLIGQVTEGERGVVWSGQARGKS